MIGRIALLVVALSALATAAARAQQGAPPGAEPAPATIADLNGAPRPEAVAARATGAVEINGRLDEAAWAAAEVIDRFVQQDPYAGEPASERTEVRILYDDENLYFGAEMFDSDPTAMITNSLARDHNAGDGDAFGFALDPYFDSRSAFVFYVNPGGAVRDEQSSDDGRIANVAWDGMYRLETRVHEGGWTAEIAIPWSTLRFQGGPGSQVWRLHLLRRIRHKSENAMWAPIDRQLSIRDISRGGTLRGLTDLEPGRNLSLKPYVLTSRPEGDLHTGESAEFDGGVDLKYGLTPGLTLDLSVNTDFSQVEVDQQQVNLTRFNLFFPERRTFFLENAGTFQFGDQAPFRRRSGVSTRDFTLFHSRRIGLTPDGAPLPILGGTRVSGTLGGTSLGVLTMQTRSEGEFEPENFAVARVRAEPIRGLKVGAIFVNRSTTSSGSASGQSYGADLDFGAFNDYLLVQSYLAGTGGTAADGSPRPRGTAGRVSVAWRDPFWEIETMYRRFDDDFDPVVGFVRRSGIHHGFGTVGVHHRVQWPVLREINPYALTHYFADMEGTLQTREVRGGLDVELRNRSIGRLSVASLRERVTAPFRVSGVTVQPGTYDFSEAALGYEGDRARPLSGTVEVETGGYYGGDRFSVSGTVLARFGKGVIFDLSARHNRIDLPGFATTSADVYGAGLDLFFSTRMLTNASVQYNQATEELITNVRVNWIHAPLSDLFLVLTERRDTAAGRVPERVLALKVTKLLSF